MPHFIADVVCALLWLHFELWQQLPTTTPAHGSECVVSSAQFSTRFFCFEFSSRFTHTADVNCVILYNIQLFSSASFRAFHECARIYAARVRILFRRYYYYLPFKNHQPLKLFYISLTLTEPRIVVKIYAANRSLTHTRTLKSTWK